MRRYALLLGLILAALSTGVAHALDKVDPYICPTQLHGSGVDCFLEAVPQTYTMCRQIKSIEIIEFGLKGAQEGVNGAKTEYCFDKHRLTMTRPYQAALREAASNKAEVEGISKLYDTWLAQLIPVAGETDEVYKQRVMRPYGEFSEQIKKIRALEKAPAKPAAAQSKEKKKTAK